MLKYKQHVLQNVNKVEFLVIDIIEISFDNIVENLLPAIEIINIIIIVIMIMIMIEKINKIIK